jgi:benzoate-CoA ligase
LNIYHENLFDILTHHAARKGNKTAIYYCGEEITYSKLLEYINRAGNILKNLGIRQKDRVLIALPDCPDTIYTFLGAIKIGAIPVLLNPDFKRETCEFILYDCEASALITLKSKEISAIKSGFLRFKLYIDDNHYNDLLTQSSPDSETSPEKDINFIMYTSGSTGSPKGIAHRLSDITFIAETYGRQVLNMTDRDITFSASKLFFAYGFGNSLAFPLTTGASTVLFPHKTVPLEVINVISEYKPTLFFGVPTLYNMMIKAMGEKIIFPSVRLCISAGEFLPQGIWHEWKEITGFEIIDGLGTTETMHIVISNRPGNIRPGSSGFPVPGYKVKIVGDDGRVVPPGTQGHLLIKGDSNTPFYWNRPYKTKETMLPEGWIKTGDIYIEKNGWYTYQGRSDDMFKVDGNWVSPVQVEQAIKEHPSVLECGVTWRKLEELVKPIACVVLRKGVSKAPEMSRDIRDFILKKLPEYMCPVQIIFTEEIPKTDTGKIQRFKLLTGISINKEYLKEGD